MKIIDRLPRPIARPIELVVRAVSQFVADGCLDLAARLSDYTALSLAPLVILALTLAGLVWDDGAAATRLVAQVERLFGTTGATAIEEIMKAGNQETGAGLAAVLGVAVLLFGATVAFASLQEALNFIWRVEPRPGRDLWNFVRKRLLSLATMGMLGFLMLVSLIASSLLTVVLDGLHALLPFDDAWLVRLGDITLSVALYTGLFAFIFKFLPDVRIAWRSVWVGAAVTGVLFELGKWLIGVYIASSAVISSYGAATSLVAFLVWVYYSASILFFGAEFTQVWATRYGDGIEPDSHAVPLDPETPPEDVPSKTRVPEREPATADR